MKRLYHILALAALIQFFSLCGFLGFLFGTGRLSPERIRQIGDMLRGGTETMAATTAPASQPAIKPETASTEIARSRMHQEMIALAVERQMRELSDMVKLSQSIQHEVQKRIEEIEYREKRFADQQQKMKAEGQPDGFVRELEVLSSIDAKKSLELLMAKKDPDAVRLLMEMDSGRVRKVFDACKTGAQMEWAGRILAELHNMNSSQTNAEAGGASQSPTKGG